MHHSSTILQLQGTASAAQGDIEALLEKQKAIENLTSSLMNERDALTTALAERTAALDALQQQHTQAEATILQRENELLTLQNSFADLQTHVVDPLWQAGITAEIERRHAPATVREIGGHLHPPGRHDGERAGIPSLGREVAPHFVDQASRDI